MDTTKIPVQKPITSITSTSKVPVINQNADVINKIVIYGLAVTAGFALKTTVQSFVFDVLGLTNKKAEGNNTKLGSVIEMLIEMRMEARANKNWALSDEIRDKLAVLDIQLKDGKEGTSFTL